jgi:hypothetical protein
MSRRRIPSTVVRGGDPPLRSREVPWPGSVDRLESGTLPANERAGHFYRVVARQADDSAGSWTKWSVHLGKLEVVYRMRVRRSLEFDARLAECREEMVISERALLLF